MIDFKDEILEGEPRYRVRDANGNLIHDNVSIELATSVAQEGTSLNKVFFDAWAARFKLATEYSEWEKTEEMVEETYVSKPSDWENQSPVTGDSLLVNKTNGLTLSTSADNDTPITNMVDGNLSSSTTSYGRLTIKKAEKFTLKRLVISAKRYYSFGTLYLSTSSTFPAGTRVGYGNGAFDATPLNGDQDTYYMVMKGDNEGEVIKMLIDEFTSITYDIRSNTYTFKGLDEIENGTAIKIKIPDSANDNYPTVLKVGGVSQYMGYSMKAGKLYDLVYTDGKIKFVEE